MRFRTIWLVLLIVGIAGGALTAGLWASKSSAENCTKHEIVIQDSTVTPKNTTGKLCDTMTITNKDDVTRLMAFGVHDSHQAYDGITDRVLKKDESVTVTFNKTGEFHFHDHMHDEVEGFFTVTK